MLSIFSKVKKFGLKRAFVLVLVHQYVRFKKIIYFYIFLIINLIFILKVYFSLLSLLVKEQLVLV